MRQTRFHVIVSGMIAGDPGQGGAAWAVLQYVLGLKRLGHEVTLIEPLNRSAIRPPGASLQCSENAAYFRQTAASFGLENNSGLLLEGTTDSIGLPYPELRTIAKKATVLLNISGML